MSAFEMAEITRLILGSDPSVTTVWLGLFAIVPLILLLLGQVLLGSSGLLRNRGVAESMTVLIVPLLAAFAFVLGTRFLVILGYL